MRWKGDILEWGAMNQFNKFHGFRADRGDGARCGLAAGTTKPDYGSPPPPPELDSLQHHYSFIKISNFTYICIQNRGDNFNIISCNPNPPPVSIMASSLQRILPSHHRQLQGFAKLAWLASPSLPRFLYTSPPLSKALPPRPKPPPDAEIEESYLKGSGPGGQKIVWQSPVLKQVPFVIVRLIHTG